MNITEERINMSLDELIKAKKKQGSREKKIKAKAENKGAKPGQKKQQNAAAQKVNISVGQGKAKRAAAVNQVTILIFL
jgi:hypothetical protein